ncbi:hypothetical protein B0T20DRAFT_389387 [Sordaria brevicollis]|uniref:Uncharacterized protein n=1 Tax=Sordaria brevicollis TaxID=83679 RepID=A0AAE0PK07_SORBR|nr:hypothetical protein B0T20DRAFT_389387 [Sordaria brevicollis]
MLTGKRAVLVHVPLIAQADTQLKLLAQFKKEVTDSDPGSVYMTPTNAGEQIREAGHCSLIALSLTIMRIIVAASSHHRSWLPAALSRPPEVPPPHSPISGINRTAHPLNLWFVISPAHLLTTRNKLMWTTLANENNNGFLGSYEAVGGRTPMRGGLIAVLIASQVDAPITKHQPLLHRLLLLALLNDDTPPRGPPPLPSKSIWNVGKITGRTRTRMVKTQRSA